MVLGPHLAGQQAAANESGPLSMAFSSKETDVLRRKILLHHYTVFYIFLCSQIKKCINPISYEMVCLVRAPLSFKFCEGGNHIHESTPRAK